MEANQRLAKDMNVRHVVYSPCKIVQPRGRKMCATMQTIRRVYESFAAPEKLIWRGGAWRLPQSIAEAKIVQPFLEICRHNVVLAKHCKRNLIDTP